MPAKIFVDGNKVYEHNSKDQITKFVVELNIDAW